MSDVIIYLSIGLAVFAFLDRIPRTTEFIVVVIEVCNCDDRPKRIDLLFSVERPYIKNMCAYSLFIGNTLHIVFLYQNLQKDCIA